MKYCPQCGQERSGEEFKCVKCDVFYSRLDEILYEEQKELEKNTLKGRFKTIRAKPDLKQAIREEFKSIWKITPWKTKITLLTIFAFVFVLVFGI